MEWRTPHRLLASILTGFCCACSAATPPSSSPGKTAAKTPVLPCSAHGGVAPGAAPAASFFPPPVAGASATPIAAAPSYPPLQLADTQVRDLYSVLTGKQHRFAIALPPSFVAEPNRRYPVVYVLDGQWDFPLVATLSGGLRFDEASPELLIVGLSWGGERLNYDALRSDDYLPTRAKGRDGVEKGGGASRFLRFLEQAVLPLMERDYRADPERRVICGSSNGGLFALYALFHKPELFWGYVAISPNVGWDAQAIFETERTFRAEHPTLERRVWLSSGSAEWPEYLARERTFFTQIKASQYRGLALKVHEVAGEGHAGVKPEAYNRALRFIAEPLVASKP